MLSAYTLDRRGQAAVAGVKALPKHLAKELRDVSRDAMVPLLQREAARLSRDKVLSRIIGSARYAPYRDTPGVRFGGSRKVTGTGVPGRLLVRALEFGSDGRRYTDYLQRRKGGTTQVHRRASRQFMPDTNARGRAITPAAEAVSEEAVQLWQDTVEQLLVRAFDGEG